MPLPRRWILAASKCGICQGIPIQDHVERLQSISRHADT